MLLVGGGVEGTPEDVDCAVTNEAKVSKMLMSSRRTEKDMFGGDSNKQSSVPAK